MGNVIVLVILFVIIGAAVAYIVKAKKRGVKCIGCSAGGECSRRDGAVTACSGCSGAQGSNCG
ncbi:MAG: FeoB-associated Cys-rich membrane protein [Lachnospiraceae bacterium]|nr:FeoB-associated Cys-rich membrane protein [Lachnospiraceae bacterium]